MYELVRAGAQSWYIDCPAKIGVYDPGGGEVWFIDSGGDKDAGRKLRQILERQGWTLRGILCTHSHADHIGGCAYLQKQTGCRVFAGGIEADFTRHPLLEPSFLYGGFPPAELRHKFLMAQESEVTPFDDPAFPPAVERIPLPGHTFDMTGFRTPDGTVFLADCLCSPETLEKYGIPFLYDPAAYLATLERVETMTAPLFVPAHAAAAAEIAPLARCNREKLEAAAERLLEICAEPTAWEEILRQVFLRFDLAMSFEQYALVGSSVRSLLVWLRETGRLTAEIVDARLLWRRS